MVAPQPPAQPLPDFVVGQSYVRRSIHEVYRGQMQGGISTPKDYPVIFLFTGESGERYGYGFDGDRGDGTYWYTGEGQEGDMRMVAGNRAIRRHREEGKTLHLFKYIRRGIVEYLGQARYVDHHQEATFDSEGKPRRAIVFELEMLGGSKGTPIGNDPTDVVGARNDGLWNLPRAQLRELATQVPDAPPSERKSRAYQRNEAVKIYVLLRAAGICEGCQKEAPFKTAKGRPYLEPHHIVRRADQGPDHPRWVAALCPNCHRRVHHGEDGLQFNEQLASRISLLEPL
jgi:5-methylcytosine-specific restriction protein A